MKLAMYSGREGEPKKLGVIIGDYVASVADLYEKTPGAGTGPGDISEYLEGHPQSENALKELVGGLGGISDLPEGVDCVPLGNALFGPAVPKPAALLDYGMSPRHLRNSAFTMIRHEKKWPVTSIMSMVVERKYKKMIDRPEFRCYKGNHNGIIGDMDAPVWPVFSSYFDIEPELAVVTGPLEMRQSRDAIEKAVAGYVIFNDFSARDVQWDEMLGMMGPNRSKDFEKGNALGPFLVTPDEVGDPRKLNVTIEIGDRAVWKGTTRDYNAHPVDVMAHVNEYRSLPAGMIIGMGTVPDCCGLDRNEWLEPGDFVTITFDKLGSLRHPIPKNIGPLEPCRWKTRNFG